MYLNDNEEKIICDFLKNLDKYDMEAMKLIWQECGTIIARFDTCFEDENEDDENEPTYEEYTTFVFEVKCVSGKPPVYITEDNFFCLNYRNFPDAVMVGEIKIN